MQTLPDGAPETLNEAFAHIASVQAPTIADLQVMVLVEAAGKALYEGLAAGVEDPRVAELLARSGREELAHAHRVSRAIGRLTGTDYPVPEPQDNPYLAAPMPTPKVTREMLEGIAAAEFGGEALYEGWAAHCADPEAARLMRQNGKEEAQHGERIGEVLRMMPA